MHNVGAHNLQHLRRFVKPEHLPASIIAPRPLFPSKGIASPDASIAPVRHADTDNVLLLAQKVDYLYLLVCATSDLAYDEVVALVSTTSLSSACDWNSEICSVSVPLFPPTSEEQANQWSQCYWPTIYKKHNPFGPHPALICRATEDMQKTAGGYIGLAASVALETSDAGFGECIGAVVTGHNRSADRSAECSVIAVAGDARWHNMERGSDRDESNAMAHPVMRVIGMVAQKRHEHSVADGTEQSYFKDRPLTGLESAAFANPLSASGGYLCLDLHLYLTHEPCVMCSMAILHSRFRRVVFARRMLLTGGLSAGVDEGEAMHGLGYGMFSRSSLNWKFLAWQWIDKDLQLKHVSEDYLHA